MDAVAPRCARHPDALAPWHCEPCARDLCVACAAAAPAGQGQLPICAECGAIAAPITVPRSVATPFSTQLGPALAELKKPAAIALVLTVTCGTEYFLTFGGKGWLLGRAFELGWVLLAMRLAARGFPPFGRPTYADLAGAWLGPMARLAVSVGVLGLFAAGVVNLGDRAANPLSPALWIVAALSVLAVPPSLVGAAIEGEGASWLPVTRLLELERLVGKDMRPVRALVAAWVGTEVISALLAPLDLVGDMRLQFHIAIATLVRLASVFALAALASVVGRLVFVRADELEHGDVEKRRIAIAPDARPTGTYVPKPPDPEELARAAQRYAPIELEDPLEALKSAIARGDANGASSRYVEDAQLAVRLTPEEQLRMAQLFSTRGDPEAAARVLRGLLMRTPNDAIAPRAMVILARLCAERLGAGGEASELYRRVVERFPESEAAKFARERLTS